MSGAVQKLVMAEIISYVTPELPNTCAPHAPKLTNYLNTSLATSPCVHTETPANASLCWVAGRSVASTSLERACCYHAQEAPPWCPPPLLSLHWVAEW